VKKRFHLSEAQLHQQVVNHLRWALPADTALHHSVNESKGTARWHRQRLDKGMHPGWPDLEIIYRGRFIGIELKSKVGRLSPNQKKCHRAIILAGGVVEVARSLDDVIGFLSQLIPLRGTNDKRTDDAG